MAKIGGKPKTLVSGMSNPMGTDRPTMTVKPPVEEPKHLAILSNTIANIPEEFADELYMVEEGAGVPNPYVKFFALTAKDAADTMGALKGVKPGNPVIYYPDEQLEILNPFKFFMLHGSQCWIREDAVGEVIEVSFEQQRGKEWNTMITAVCLFFTPDGVLVPATCSFRGAKCPVAARAINYRALTNDPSWATLDKDNEFAARFDQLKYRFTTTGTFATKRNKADTNDYVQCDGVCKATTIGEAKTLNEFFEDEEMQDLLGFCWDSYKSYLETLQAMEQGEA